MSEIETELNDILLDIKPIEEVVKETTIEEDVMSKIEKDTKIAVEIEKIKESEQQIFEKPMATKKKTKRKCSEKQRANLAKMREAKSRKAEERRKLREERKMLEQEHFIENIKNTNKNKETPTPKRKSQQTNEDDDDALFKKMERMIGLMERMGKINNRNISHKKEKDTDYVNHNTHNTKKLPPQKKTNLYGYDDFF